MQIASDVGFQTTVLEDVTLEVVPFGSQCNAGSDESCNADFDETCNGDFAEKCKVDSGEKCKVDSGEKCNADFAEKCNADSVRRALGVESHFRVWASGEVKLCELYPALLHPTNAGG